MKLTKIISNNNNNNNNNNLGTILQQIKLLNN